MTSTPVHDLYRRWLEELWNGDLSAAQHLVTDDFVGHWSDRDINDILRVRDGHFAEYWTASSSGS